MLVCIDTFVPALNRHHITPYLPIVRRECIFVIMWNIDLHALSVVFSRLFQLKLHIQLLWCIKYILLPKLWKYLEYVQLDNFSEKAKNGGPSSAHLSWICFLLIWKWTKWLTRTYTGNTTYLQYTTALLGDIYTDCVLKLDKNIMWVYLTLLL
jgi:hypothetical protein